LQLALRAAATLNSRHLIVAINSAARLDRLCPARLAKSIEFGCISPPFGRMSGAIRPVRNIMQGWKPGAVVFWHPALSPIAESLQHMGATLIQGWNAPTGGPESRVHGGEDTQTFESRVLTTHMPPASPTTPTTPTSAMARSLAREQLGIALDDERPLVTLLPNVPEMADAWWFSTIMGLLESAQIGFIGAIPSLARQRGRARRFRHACGLLTPAIEFDQPLKLMLDASDVVISIGRDSDRDVEVEETAPAPGGTASGSTVLDRVVLCQALAGAVPTIVSAAHGTVVPGGLRAMLVADGTRASKVAARVHAILAQPGALDMTRRLLSGAVIPRPDAEIVSWVHDRLALRELKAHGRMLAGVA
jgi:hypothetical protein